MTKDAIDIDGKIPKVEEEQNYDVASAKYEGILSYGYGLAPMLITADRRVCSTAFRLYCILSAYATNGKAFPGQKVLSDILGIRIPRVSGLTSELEMYGYIKKIRDRKNNGLTYELLTNVDVEVEEGLFGTTIIKSKKKRKKKVANKKTIPKEDIDRVVTYYFKKFQRTHECDPEWNEAQGRAIIVRYLHKYDLIFMKNILDEWFEDDWGEKVGHTITCLQAGFNRLKIKVERKDNTNGYGIKAKVQGLR
jgi:hypothetical protein